MSSDPRNLFLILVAPGHACVARSFPMGNSGGSVPAPLDRPSTKDVCTDSNAVLVEEFAKFWYLKSVPNILEGGGSKVITNLWISFMYGS